MILQQLKLKLQSVHCIERSALAKEFKLSDDGIDAMLSIWVKKGCVKRTNVSGCAGCTSCGDSASEVIYEWLNQTVGDIPVTHR